MSRNFAPEHEGFRQEVAAWLDEQLSGPFAHLRGLNNHVDAIPERREWEAALGKARYGCIGWPEQWGGRAASIAEQVIFAEEYARAKAPSRIGHIGVELAGPTLLLHGTEEQKRNFLPGIASGADIWCQGYSEPNAGSDLSNVRTTAWLKDGRWIINGQKVWTSMAQFSDWAFVICRADSGTRGASGLAYLLVPMRQPGVTIRPIRQMTGEAEFNEVFFDNAETEAENIVGQPGEGWKVAMATLAFERGVSTLGQQMHFRNELEELIALAKANGAARSPLIRQRLAKAHVGLTVMRASALRMLANGEANTPTPGVYTYKLYWALWRRSLGELAMDVQGLAGQVGQGDSDFGALTHMHLMSRAETIYAGTNQIQRNIIAERALGLPREARGGLHA
ncbi:acyl-CoA dehydrogenase family protein [Brevundimonas diminuta]|uniref:acyl-CoA dehydrogenase family protein n=1 Tax=Brevundimonas diminuta TaxID=293 RepID=UPI0032087004